MNPRAATPDSVRLDRFAVKASLLNQNKTWWQQWGLVLAGAVCAWAGPAITAIALHASSPLWYLLAIGSVVALVGSLVGALNRMHPSSLTYSKQMPGFIDSMGDFLGKVQETENKAMSWPERCQAICDGASKPLAHLRTDTRIAFYESTAGKAGEATPRLVIAKYSGRSDVPEYFLSRGKDLGERAMDAFENEDHDPKPFFRRTGPLRPQNLSRWNSALFVPVFPEPSAVEEGQPREAVGVVRIDSPSLDGFTAVDTEMGLSIAKVLGYYKTQALLDSRDPHPEVRDVWQRLPKRPRTK